MKRLISAGLAICLGLLLASCGGGGGGGGRGGADTSIRMFATDSLNAGYSNVWVQLRKVQLESSDGPVTIFDETASGGRWVDLRALRDGGGQRYLFLTDAPLPGGFYTGVTVTVGRTLGIVPSASTATKDVTFIDGSGDNMTFSFTFRTPIDFSLQPNFVVDFDLGAWDESVGQVTTSTNYIRTGAATNIDNLSRHEESDYSGTVSSVVGVAPSQRFVLTNGTETVNVATDSATVIFHNDGAVNPELLAGSRVQVTGVFKSSTEFLLARRIKIEREAESSNTRVEGLVTRADRSAGTYDVSLARSTGFFPGGTALMVATDASARYFGPSGLSLSKNDFLAEVKRNVTVLKVEGSAVSRTEIKGKYFRLEQDIDATHSRDARLVGTIKDLNVAAKTFSLTISQWEGVSLNVGRVVQVAATTLPDGLADGNVVTATGTFGLEAAALSATSVVKQ